MDILGLEATTSLTRRLKSYFVIFRKKTPGSDEQEPPNTLRK